MLLSKPTLPFLFVPFHEETASERAITGRPSLGIMSHSALYKLTFDLMSMCSFASCG